MNPEHRTNYKSTIGGAFAAAGTMLAGIGIVPQLVGSPSRLLTYVALTGFIFQAIGTFLAHLFSADASAVRDLKAQVVENTAGISVLKGNTPNPFPEDK